MSRPTPETPVAFDSNRLTEAWPKLTVADPQASKMAFQETYAKVLRGAFDKKSSCQGLYARTPYFAASRFEGIATDTPPYHYCGIHASCHIYGTMKCLKSETSRTQVVVTILQSRLMMCILRRNRHPMFAVLCSWRTPVLCSNHHDIMMRFTSMLFTERM